MNRLLKTESTEQMHIYKDLLICWVTCLFVISGLTSCMVIFFSNFSLMQCQPQKHLNLNTTVDLMQGSKTIYLQEVEYHLHEAGGWQLVDSTSYTISASFTPFSLPDNQTQPCQFEGKFIQIQDLDWSTFYVLFINSFWVGFSGVMFLYYRSRIHRLKEENTPLVQ